MGFRFPKDNLGCNESFCVQKQPFADAIQNSILRNFSVHQAKDFKLQKFFQVKPSSMILNEVNFKTTIILRLI